MSDDTAAHVEAVAYADDFYGPDERPDDYERRYCEEDGEDWPCRTVLIAERDEARAALAAARVSTLEELLDPEVGWKLRAVVEDELVEWRDAGRSFLGRANGLSINYRDGSPGPIRFGFEHGFRVAIQARIDELATPTPKPEEAKINE